MYPPMDKSPRLTATSGLHHGFFGRAGGVSDGDFASLNASVAVGDDRANVEENIRRAVMALRSGPVPVAIIRQVHGTHVHVATEAAPPGHRPEADAIVTDRTGLALGILTADCAPVILADPVAGVVAVAHAGWRGAVGGILENTMHAMADLGAQPHRIVGAVGPTIAPESYEVGPDFVDTLTRDHPDALAFLIAGQDGEKPRFDLRALVCARAEAIGIPPLDRVGGDTYAEPARYFSHRFATHNAIRAGRQIALVVKS